MLAATRVKMGGSEKKIVNKNKYDISSIKRVTRKFHVVVVQNNGNEMYKKICCACKVALLLITPIVVFSPFSLPLPLGITRFYILFGQIKLYILSRALLLALAKSNDDDNDDDDDKQLQCMCTIPVCEIAICYN